MALLDFLFQGSAPPSVTNYGTTTQNLPQWYSDYTQGMIGRANAIAAEPYQPYTGPRVAGATPDTNQAYDLTRQNVGSADPFINQAQNLYTQGGNASGVNAASPWLGAAGSYSSLGAAQPLINQASQTLPGGINDYMSPYTQGVVDRIAQLGQRNLSENLLPSVNDVFTKSGQFGSTRHADITGRAVRDANESILGQQAQALESGYNQAGQMFQADQSRLGNLAQLTGQLGAETARRQLDVGAQMGSLTGADAQRQLQAGQGLGALGQLAQSSGLRDAAALQAIGQEQQGLNQKSLDTAYQNFLEQRNYPRSNIDFLNSAIRGVQMPTSQTSSGTSPATAVGASPLAQLAGVGSSIYGLSQLGLFKRGGQVGYKRGGRVGPLGGRMRGGALAMVR